MTSRRYDIMKSVKLVITLASAVIVLSAAVCAVVIFQEELLKLFGTCRDYCKGLICRKGKEVKEFEDYADVE